MQSRVARHDQQTKEPSQETFPMEVGGKHKSLMRHGSVEAHFIGTVLFEWKKEGPPK
jgi:hypothetical protein